jgi:DNA polymerase I-like protein with 3'-5' exonuclease and polymerase domains
VVQALRAVLTHPNARVINQNLSFDIQYLFWRFYLRPKAHFDTMIAQNLLWPGLPKDLAFLASMYCQHYVYWKDDGKFWKDPSVGDEAIWSYNCLDCCYTFEVYEAQRDLIEHEGLAPQMAFQMKTFENLMGMMIRGVRVDMEARKTLFGELTSLIGTLHEEVAYLCQRDLTGEKGSFSHKKMVDLFYNDLKIKPFYNGEGGLTCDDETLKKIAKRAPWLRPLTERINMIRSYGTALDVCRKRTDRDGRMRTSYNVAGTSTFRLSSSENPLDSGMNLQNLTLGRDILSE